MIEIISGAALISIKQEIVVEIPTSPEENMAAAKSSIIPGLEYNAMPPKVSNLNLYPIFACLLVSKTCINKQTLVQTKTFRLTPVPKSTHLYNSNCFIACSRI